MYYTLPGAAAVHPRDLNGQQQAVQGTGCGAAAEMGKIHETVGRDHAHLDALEGSWIKSGELAL